MPTPHVILISRKSLIHAEDAIKEQIAAFGVKMAVAVAPEDAEQAKKLTDAVGQFQHVTALVADFPFDMVVNDDGSCEIIGMAMPQQPEQPLIEKV